MKLISCTECGAVLDQDVLVPDRNSKEYESMFYEENWDIKMENAQWDGDRFVACVECPVCKKKVETNVSLS